MGKGDSAAMKTATMFLISLVATALLALNASAQLGGTAGAFTRLGFGARGQGMGNAMSAISSGIISSYYNPALTPFQDGHVLYGNYGVLSLDRKLNQISYTQNIRLERTGVKKFADDPDLLSIAGISAGWINAGDADIQGYDSDGFKTDKLSVFENQFFLNFGNRFSEKLSFGFNVKFYYSGLYTNVTSSGFGLDIGALYSLNENINISLVAQELLTKYKWDTSTLYGPQRGNATEDPFARIFKLGVAYSLPASSLIVAGELEMYDGKTILGRIGGEVYAIERMALRAGIQRLDISNKGISAKPSFGISFSQPLSQFMPVVNYAFILEPVTTSPTHVLSFALSF